MPKPDGFHSSIILFGLGNARAFGFQVQSEPCEAHGGHASFQEIWAKIVMKDWSFAKSTDDFGD